MSKIQNCHAKCISIIDDCHIVFIMSCLIVSNMGLWPAFYFVIFHALCLTILDTTDTRFLQPWVEDMQNNSMLSQLRLRLS